MGCTFCATGTMGFKGNLTPGEIVEQLVHASRVTSIRNVVFMVTGFVMFTAVLLYDHLTFFWWQLIALHVLLRVNLYLIGNWDLLQGMGEPMNNYAAVVQAVKTMTGRFFCLSPKHITISTVSFSFLWHWEKSRGFRLFFFVSSKVRRLKICHL